LVHLGVEPGNALELHHQLVFVETVRENALAHLRVQGQVVVGADVLRRLNFAQQVCNQLLASTRLLGIQNLHLLLSEDFDELLDLLVTLAEERVLYPVEEDFALDALLDLRDLGLEVAGGVEAPDQFSILLAEQVTEDAGGVEVVVMKLPLLLEELLHLVEELFAVVLNFSLV